MFGFAGLIGLLVIWSIIWKGLALWRAARLENRGWFVALLLINTVGILDIIYLAIITKEQSPPPAPPPVPTP